MEIAIWTIATVEIIRMLQNALQIYMMSKSNTNKQMKRATDEFIKSLNKTDAIDEFIKGFYEFAHYDPLNMKFEVHEEDLLRFIESLKEQNNGRD